MKSFVIFLTVIGCAISYHQDFVAPGEITAETLWSEQNRIAAGAVGKKTENQDFCYINAQFIQKWQVCGCVIIDAAWVATSARCVVDNSEGRATNITVTITGLTGKAAVKKITKFVVPDGTNGADATNAATLDAYDPLADIPFSTVVTGNVAMIQLETPLTPKENDGKKVKLAKFVTSADWETFVKDYSTYKFRVCGTGVTDNKGTKAKGVICTDVNPISNDACANPPDLPAATIPEEAICLKWPDRENNICSGDYGGPAWAYKFDAAGKMIDQQLFGITVGSPNIRGNSPCQGGQTIVVEFTPGKVQNWIQGIVAGRVVA